MRIDNVPSERISVKVSQCCICGRPFKGYGHSPIPVKPGGVCCDACNVIVLSRRIQLSKKQ